MHILKYLETVPVAQNNAVTPRLSRWLTLAPDSTNSLTTSSCV